MKKVSIIGSNSFIARNLITYLEQFKNDYKLFLYDFGEDDIHENYRKVDFSDKESVNKINFDVDVIFIFIGRTGGVQGFDEYSSFIEINEIFFLNILKCYCEQECRPRIIYPGSRLVFEDSDDVISENSAFQPKSIYAVTKVACENYLKIYKEAFGLDYVVLRICTPYGTLIDSKGNYGTFEIFWNQALKDKKITVFGDGNQRKTFTQMVDICEAYKRLIDANSIKYESYNLGGQALSINDVVNEIAKEANVEIEHVPWPDIYKVSDGGSVVFDSSRFDSEFGINYHKVI